MTRKYTQEYALDDPTRTKAEELYREFYIRNISKNPTVSNSTAFNMQLTFKKEKNQDTLVFLKLNKRYTNRVVPLVLLFLVAALIMPKDYQACKQEILEPNKFFVIYEFFSSRSTI